MNRLNLKENALKVAITQNKRAAHDQAPNIEMKIFKSGGLDE